MSDALKLNPHSEETLGPAGGRVLPRSTGSSQTGPDTRFGKLAAEVSERNPHAGIFFETLADALDRLRRWPAAAHYYQEAMTAHAAACPRRPASWA